MVGRRESEVCFYVDAGVDLKDIVEGLWWLEGKACKYVVLKEW